MKSRNTNIHNFRIQSSLKTKIYRKVTKNLETFGPFVGDIEISWCIQISLLEIFIEKSPSFVQVNLIE